MARELVLILEFLQAGHVGISIGHQLNCDQANRIFVRDVFDSVIRLDAPGLAVGALLAVGLAMLTRSMLLGVGSLDPVSLGSATGLLIPVVLLASLVPARRAAAIDPMKVLHNQ